MYAANLAITVCNVHGPQASTAYTTVLDHLHAKAKMTSKERKHVVYWKKSFGIPFKQRWPFPLQFQWACCWPPIIPQCLSLCSDEQRLMTKLLSDWLQRQENHSWVLSWTWSHQLMGADCDDPQCWTHNSTCWIMADEPHCYMIVIIGPATPANYIRPSSWLVATWTVWHRPN